MKRSITDFFLNELTDYSCYSTIRMLGSAIDGLKNSQRKIIHTALNKLKTSTKVSVFDNQMQSYTQYLHGSAAQVVSNMGASYVGSNNLPLLKGEGNFGTRMVRESAAPRYIYVSNQPYINELFDIRDVLISQEFEGSKIEPLFYVPCIPLILVNGSMNCLASGFKQHILPRSIKDIIDYYNGKKTELKPYIKGFQGFVTQGDNPKKWELNGLFEVKKNKVHIIEIPPFIEYQKYLEILDDLVEKKKIKSYKDLSNVKTQTFEFEVILNKELDTGKIFDLLKLSLSQTEIYNCIDENNKVRQFNSVTEILDYFKEVRVKYLEKQRIFNINVTKETLLLNASKYKFIQMIINDELKIYKRKKKDIESDLQKTNLYNPGNYDYLLNMSIHSFTEETLKILHSKIEDLQKVLKDLETLDTQKEFILKLKEF